MMNSDVVIVNAQRLQRPDETINIDLPAYFMYKLNVTDKKRVISASSTIMKICLYNFDPLKPHFYIVKLGFTGVYIIFLISAQKHRLWVLVRTASRSGSNEYPQPMFCAEI